MTRLVKFMQKGYSIADWLNTQHLRAVILNYDFATLDMTGGQEYVVTVEEANRLIAEINYDLFAPSEVEHIAKAIAVSEIEEANKAFSQPATVPPIAPPQDDTSLGAFCSMIRTGDYVVLDTETTGLDDGEIVQIAVIDSKSNTLLDTLVRPKMPIPADATRIHGITNEMVEDAASWVFVRAELERILRGRHVVIYNAVYDRKMMHKSSERWGLPKTEWKELAAFWCAMEAFAEEFGDWNEYRQSYKWQKLETAARHYGIKIDGTAHTALTDCKTTLAVCKAMAGA